MPTAPEPHRRAKHGKPHKVFIANNSKERRRDRPGSTARGYNYKWQRARKEYLKRNPLCVMCPQPNAANVVDHIVPHKMDYKLMWNEDNWQSLCFRCHNSAKQRIERGRGR